MSKLEAAKRLIRYGLTRQQVGCPIGELNPGARARLLLAGFAARKVNALVLDEPTNHLDEEAVVEVAASLRTFQGTAIVVSHNSNFIDSLQLTKLLRLSEAGLERLESMHDFENELEEAVSTVVAWSLG